MRRREAIARGCLPISARRFQKIEPPQGDPLRRAGPLTPKGKDAWFAFLNFNKSSVALDPDDKDAGVTSLRRLIAGCDILIDSRDIDAADCPVIDLAALKQRNPGLIHVEASWFGKDGPYARFEATNTTIRALTGLVKLVGPVGGPPMHAPDFQTGILGRPLGVHRGRLVGPRPDARRPRSAAAR